MADSKQISVGDTVHVRAKYEAKGAVYSNVLFSTSDGYKRVTVCNSDIVHVEPRRARRLGARRVNLDNEQTRFLLLHARHLVVKWCWLWQGTMLRAFTDSGGTATISKGGLKALVASGMVEEYGPDAAGVKLLDAGKAAVA